jgi:CRP-like cAMP-binding protein
LKPDHGLQFTLRFDHFLIYRPPARFNNVKLLNNGLMSQLPTLEQSLLEAACEPITLKSGQLLGSNKDEPQVYFLTGATVAMMVQDEHHMGVAVGLLGAEHVVGLEHVLESSSPTLQHRVQTTGAAWRMTARSLQAMALGRPSVLRAISRQMWFMLSHVAMFAASIQTLDIQARLAAWLLLSAQTAQTTHLHLTHEHLAHMLGVRRVSITLAAGQLREQGLLSYCRGQVHLLDLSGLAQAAQTL